MQPSNCVIISWFHKKVIVMMSIIKMRGPIDVLFAFKIFSLPVPTRPGTRTFWQVPDLSRPEVKILYPSDPDPIQGGWLWVRQQ